MGRVRRVVSCQEFARLFSPSEIAPRLAVLMVTQTYFFAWMKQSSPYLCSPLVLGCEHKSVELGEKNKVLKKKKKKKRKKLKLKPKNKRGKTKIKNRKEDGKREKGER